MTIARDQKTPATVKLSDCYTDLVNHKHAALNQKLQTVQLPDESVNKFGLTLLQQTAREGMIEACLRLMQGGALLVPAIISDNSYHHADVKSVKENVRKAPDDFAKERGHSLLSDILEVYVADPIHAIDHTVRNAVLFWLVENDRSGDMFFPTTATSQKDAADEKHLRSADISEEMLSRFIEFAAFRKNKKLVEHFLKAGKLKNDPAQLSAGYWAAVNDDKDMGQLVCADDDSVILKLQQLLGVSGKADLYIKHFAVATPEQYKKYGDAEIEVVIDKAVLTPKQKKLYQALSLAQADVALKLVSSGEDWIACADYALKTQNFVAFSELKKLTTDCEVFLVKACQQNKKNLARFWLIVNNIDPYEFVLKHQADKLVVKFIIENCSSAAGFLHYVMSRNVKLSPSIRQKAEVALLEEHLKADPVLVLDVFLKCLNDANPDEAFDSLLTSRAASIELRAKKVDVPGYIGRLIQNSMQRLGVVVNLQNKNIDQKTLGFSSIPSVQIKHINSYLTTRDSAVFSVTSPSVFGDLVSDNKQNSENMASRIEVIERQKNLIQRFEKSVVADLEQKGCSSDRVCCDCDERCCCCGSESDLPHQRSDWAYYTVITFSVLGSASAGISAWQTWAFSGTLSQRIDLCNEFQNVTADQGRLTCYAAQISGSGYCFSTPSCSPYNTGLTNFGILVECVDLCNRLLALELDGIGEGFGAVPTAIFALTVFWIIWCIRNSIRGPERLELLPVTDYSDETLKAVKDLFDEFNHRPKSMAQSKDAKGEAKADEKHSAAADEKYAVRAAEKPTESFAPKIPTKSKADFSQLSTASTIQAIRAQTAIVCAEAKIISGILGKLKPTSKQETPAIAGAFAANDAKSSGSPKADPMSSAAANLKKFGISAAAAVVPIAGLDDLVVQLNQPLLDAKHT